MCDGRPKTYQVPEAILHRPAAEVQAWQGTRTACGTSMMMPRPDSVPDASALEACMGLLGYRMPVQGPGRLAGGQG